MKQIILLLIFMTAKILPAQGPNVQNGASAQISSELEAMIEECFENVLLERNLDRAMEYFADLEDFKGSPSNSSIPVKLTHLNYDMRKTEYLGDWERMMNLLPRQGLGNIRIIHLRRIVDPAAGGLFMVEVSCSYDLSGGQFRFVTPQVVEQDGRWQFKSRFGSLLEFVR